MVQLQFGVMWIVNQIAMLYSINTYKYYHQSECVRCRGDCVCVHVWARWGRMRGMHAVIRIRVHRKKTAESGAVTWFFFLSFFCYSWIAGMQQLIVGRSCVKNTAEKVGILFSSKLIYRHPHRKERDSGNFAALATLAVLPAAAAPGAHGARGAAAAPGSRRSQWGVCCYCIYSARWLLEVYCTFCLRRPILQSSIHTDWPRTMESLAGGTLVVGTMLYYSNLQSELALWFRTVLRTQTSQARQMHEWMNKYPKFKVLVLMKF